MTNQYQYINTQCGLQHLLHSCRHSVVAPLIPPKEKSKCKHALTIHRDICSRFRGLLYYVTPTARGLKIHMSKNATAFMIMGSSYSKNC